MTTRTVPDIAVRLRALLERAGLSQRGAARELDISERTMRYYVSGEQEVPRAILMALEYITGDPVFFKRLELRARREAGCSCGAFEIGTYESGEPTVQRSVASLMPGTCDACADGVTGEVAMRLLSGAGVEMEQTSHARRRGGK